MFISWWCLQDILARNNFLFYLSEEFTPRSKKILNASICLFQTFGKFKIPGSYEGKPTLDLQKLRRRFSFVSLSSFFRNNAETILFFISKIFLKPNRFWFQKNDGKNIDWRQKEMVGKNTQNDETIINIIYMEPDFSIIKKIVRKL